jgi:hypothetical protein
MLQFEIKKSLTNRSFGVFERIRKNHRNPIKASCFVKESEKHKKISLRAIFCLCSLDFSIRFAQNVAEHREKKKEIVKKLMRIERISLLAASGDWVQVVNT